MKAPHPLMTSAEVAAAFRVRTGAVHRYAVTGQLASIRVGPGGDHRYWRAQVSAILAGKPFTAEQLEQAREQALEDAIGGRL